MTQATRHAESNELTLLRTPGDWTRAHLAIYKPNLIYTAVLDDVPASNDVVGEITFTGGSEELDIDDVKSEMTLWVGSAATAKDLGTCRIRKAPVGSTIYIGYTSEIDWAGAATVHLTIVDSAALRAKPVLNVSGVTYMDGEHAYNDDQHVDFDPVPVMSCHGVGTLVDGSVDLEWDASNSWVFDSEIDTYLWEAPGSASIDDDESATPVITYETAGNYPVYCTVTALNGKSATGVQFAFIFDEDNKPYAVDVQAPSASYDEGGWSFNVRMYADADPTDVIEGALCVLWAEDWYGVTKQSIGQMVNRENIICWGWIAGETIEWDAEAPAVEFTVAGPHYWLGKISANITQLEFMNGSPTAWSMMPGLTVDRALWHILHWRSNATALLNITLTGDERYALKIETMEGTLWAQLSEIAWGKIFGRIGCDRLGRLFAVIDPQMVPDRTWDSVMTLTKKDWKERVDVGRTPQRKLAMFFLSGWAVNETGAAITLYSLAMGHIEAHTGDTDIIDKVLAESQPKLNELAGLYMGWKNNQLEFDFSLAQNNRMIDLWPNQFLDVSLTAGDTPRGIAYTGNLIPRSITLQPDLEAGCWSTEISCEAETFAELAVDGDIPGTEFPATDDFDFGGKVKFPKLPELTPIPGGDPYGGTAPSRVLVHDENLGLIYSKNFNETDPTAVVWQMLNWGLLDYEYQNIENMIMTPGGGVYVATASAVWYASSPESKYKKVFGLEEFESGFADLLTVSGGFYAAYYGGFAVYGMGMNPSGKIALLVGATGIGRIALGDSGGFSVHAPPGDPGDWFEVGQIRGSSPGVNLGGTLSYGGGRWIAGIRSDGTPEFAAVMFNSDGSIDEATVYKRLGGYDNGFHSRLGSSSSALFRHIEAGLDVLSETSNNFATSTDSAVTPPGSMWANDVTGQYILCVNGANMYKSSDAGSSWSAAIAKPLSALQLVSNALCVDEDRWIVIAKSNSAAYTPIAYTPDFGTTFELKHGNLSALFPSTVLSWDLIQALP
jgi:hypothetical protein